MTTQLKGEGADKTIAAAVDSGETESAVPEPSSTVDARLTFELKRMADDPRWLRVRSHTMVKYNGHWTTFGSLSGNERMCLEFDSDGTLEGGDGLD